MVCVERPRSAGLLVLEPGGRGIECLVCLVLLPPHYCDGYLLSVWGGRALPAGVPVTPTDLNGGLALIGGVSGLALLCYFVLMVYFARQKDHHIRGLEVQLARIEGMLLSKRR